MTASKNDAVELAALARAAGLVAANAGNRNWVEIRGAITETRQQICLCAHGSLFSPLGRAFAEAVIQPRHTNTPAIPASPPARPNARLVAAGAR